MSKIRVLLVDDSPVSLAVLKRIISSSPDMEVAGAVGSAEEALTLIPRLNPHIICTDFRMPGMDGLTFTRTVMEEYPRPVLVISVSVQKGQESNIFQLLEAGALDVFPKPRGGDEAEFEKSGKELISKIRILSGVVVFRKRKTRQYPAAQVVKTARSSVRIALIGASTGGPMALHDILRGLPGDFPAPVVCVQHIGDGFLDGLVDWLASLANLKVVIATPGDMPQRGNVYFPPEGTHLEVDGSGRFVMTNSPPVNGHKPSIDVTFRSAAKYYGFTAMGVLLTGMGQDGADGMLSIRQAGGITVAQDEATSLVFGMPKQAIEREAVEYVLPLDKIAESLVILANSSSGRMGRKTNNEM